MSESYPPNGRSLKGLQSAAQVIGEQFTVTGEVQRKPQENAQESRGHVIDIESARKRLDSHPLPPQPPANTANPGRYTRRSFIAMFLVGSGIRKVARFHRSTEECVEREIRERLIAHGEFNRRAA